jgi:hypothetical protein
VIETLKKNVQKLFIMEKIYNSYDNTKYNQNITNFFSKFVQVVYHEFWKDNLGNSLEVDDTPSTVAMGPISNDQQSLENFIMGKKDPTAPQDANLVSVLTNITFQRIKKSFKMWSTSNWPSILIGTTIS